MSRWAILAALSLVRLCFGYQFQSMAALAPAIARDLGLDQVQAGTLIGLYWAPGILVALPGGWLARRFGDKPTALAGGLLMVAGGVLCAFSGSYAGLAAGRLCGGLGGIVMSLVAMKMATDWFAGREIGFALGCLLGAFPLGIALGLALQAPLGGAIGWPAVMLTTAALAAAVVAAVAWVYRAPAVAPAPAAEALAGGILGRDDILRVSAAGIGLALYNGAFLVYVSYAPALLVTNGFGLAEAGLILAVASTFSTVCLPAGGHLADRWRRPRAVLFLGTAAFTVSVALLPPAAASGSFAAVVAVAIAVGILGALPVSPMVALPAQALAPERRAIGLGLLYTWLYLGAAACPALAGWTYELAGTPAGPVYLNVVLGAATLAAYALFALLTRRG